MLPKSRWHGVKKRTPALSFFFFSSTNNSCTKAIVIFSPVSNLIDVVFGKFSDPRVTSRFLGPYPSVHHNTLPGVAAAAVVRVATGHRVSAVALRPALELSRFLLFSVYLSVHWLARLCLEHREEGIDSQQSSPRTRQPQTTEKNVCQKKGQSYDKAIFQMNRGLHHLGNKNVSKSTSYLLSIDSKTRFIEWYAKPSQAPTLQKREMTQKERLC